MVLVKLILGGDDGITVIHHAWAHPNKGYKAGDSDSLGGDFKYYDVTNQVDDPLTQTVEVPDGHTKLINGTLVVDADYTPPVMEVPEPTPSAQDAINAQLTKQLATVTQTAATAQSAVVALTKKLASEEAQPKEA